MDGVGTAVVASDGVVGGGAKSESSIFDRCCIEGEIGELDGVDLERPPRVSVVVVVQRQAVAGVEGEQEIGPVPLEGGEVSGGEVGEKRYVVARGPVVLIEDVRPEAAAEEEQIAAEATIEVIITFTALEGVVAVFSPEGVVAVFANQHIISVCSSQDVITGRAHKQIWS